MTILTIPVPDTVSSSLHLSNEALAREISLAAAMKLYELGKLSSGTAAEMAGISKPLFLSKTRDYVQGDQHWSREELEQDIRNA